MKVFEKTPTLKLHVVGTSVCLLNPGHSGLDGDDILEINPDGAPRYDTVVDGYVTLDLPDVKRIKRLQVELVCVQNPSMACCDTLIPWLVQLGRQNILIKGQYDTYELLHETLELDKETELLSPGEHRYGWCLAFIYMQRSITECVPKAMLLASSYHQTAHHMTEVHSRSNGSFRVNTAQISCSGRTYHKCVATATGLGKFGKDLIAEKPFYLSRHTAF